MVESLIKAIELCAKYSWASAVAIAFVLFVPDDAAKQLGIFPIRHQFLGQLWIALVASLALFVSSTGLLLKALISGFFSRRAEAKRYAEAKQKRREIMLSRLRSLSPQELMWFQYCLYYGRQTVFGEAHHPLAYALVKKKMLSPGSGTIWRISYTLTDEVWSMAQELTDELLPPETREKRGFERELAAFEKSLKPAVF